MAPSKQKQSSGRISRSKQASEEPKFSGVSVGETFRTAREAAEMTLDGVSNELMIRRFYLESLEDNAYRNLPERVYAIGFVRNYATFLGMDPKVMIEQFKREAYGSRNVNNYQVDLNMPEPVMHSVVPGRSAIISAGAILFVLIAAIIFFTQNNKQPTPAIPSPAATGDATSEITDPTAPDIISGGLATSIPAPATAAVPAAPAPSADMTDSAPVTEEVKEAPVAAAEATPEVTAKTPAPAVGTNRRVIEALQSSWVEIKDDKGKVLFTSILKAGQLLPLPETTKVTMTTGNAGGLRMILDGQPQEAFGQANEVKRNVVLDFPGTAPAAAPVAAVMPAEAPTSTTPKTFDQY
jgi:cytoskeleton protein RodZ